MGSWKQSGRYVNISGEITCIIDLLNQENYISRSFIEEDEGGKEEEEEEEELENQSILP